MVGTSENRAERRDRRRQADPTRSDRREKPPAVTAAAVAANGLPQPALRAYRHAESVLAEVEPGCRLPWTLLAGIGRVESDHGRYGGAVVGADGVSDPLIRGIALDGGPGIAAIPDSDGGRYDGDRVWDRAVGPMQFIPTTWAVVGVDGDADGTKNPNDIDDAALASGVYLCAGGGDLTDPSQLRSAVFRYNHSSHYVDIVTAYAAAYASGNFDSIPVPPASSAPVEPESQDSKGGKGNGHGNGNGNGHANGNANGTVTGTGMVTVKPVGPAAARAAVPVAAPVAAPAAVRVAVRAALPVLVPVLVPVAGLAVGLVAVRAAAPVAVRVAVRAVVRAAAPVLVPVAGLALGLVVGRVVRLAAAPAAVPAAVPAVGLVAVRVAVPVVGPVAGPVGPRRYPLIRTSRAIPRLTSRLRTRGTLTSASRSSPRLTRLRAHRPSG